MVSVVGGDPERAAGRSTDSLRSEGDECRGLVGDLHPQVEPRNAGHPDPAVGEEVDECRAAVAIGLGGLGHRGRDDRVLEEVQEDPLQQAAAPAGPELAPVHESVDDVAPAADGRQAQVGAVALGVAADVDDLVGESGAEALEGDAGDVAGVVVLDHEDAGAVEEFGQPVGPSG